MQSQTETAVPESEAKVELAVVTKLENLSLISIQVGDPTPAISTNGLECSKAGSEIDIAKLDQLDNAAVNQKQFSTDRSLRKLLNISNLTDQPKPTEGLEESKRILCGSS